MNQSRHYEVIRHNRNTVCENLVKFIDHVNDPISILN
jgi:hypothetical protein